MTISNRKKKRAEARNGTAIFTALRPAWLNLVDSQGKSISKGIRGRHDYDLSTTKFKVIPEAAKAIRMIFNAKLKGVTMNAIFDQYDLTKAERKELYGFACYVNKQAATKRGRFIRAIFKSKHSEKKHVSKSGLVYARPHAGQNRRVDLVPKGSIALGMELIKNDKRRKAGWRFVSGGVSYRLTLKNYGTNTHRC